jgi:hypothetical protein
MQFSIEVQGGQPSGLTPPLHVGFVLVDQMGDDVQLTLCDVDLRKLSEVFEKARDVTPGDGPVEVRLPVQPMQRVFLSSVAVQNLYEALGHVLANPKAVSSEGSQGS